MDKPTLDRYLARIGFEGSPRADVPTLRQLVLRHAQAIPFENIAAFTGQRVSLDPVDVAAKLVGRRRGGWCFEQNLLLGDALRTLGFEVQDHAARVLWGRAETARTARTHRLVQVATAQGSFMADVGFGRLTPTGILSLETDQPQQTPHERFRLRPFEGDRLLEAEVEDAASGDMRWLPMYRFDMQRQWPMDFEAANYQLAHDPASHFVTGLILARPAPEGRYSLRGRSFTFRSFEGPTEQRQMASFDELQQVMENHFGLDARDMPGLATRFAQQP